MRMEETTIAIARLRKKRPSCISDVCCPAGNSAAWNHDCLRAVTRPWRAGAGIGDFVRRTNRDLGKLRFNRDPLVADPQRGRAGAPFPCRRRQRGSPVEGRARGDRGS